MPGSCCTCQLYVNPCAGTLTGYKVQNDVHLHRWTPGIRILTSTCFPRTISASLEEQSEYPKDNYFLHDLLVCPDLYPL